MYRSRWSLSRPFFKTALREAPCRALRFESYQLLKKTAKIHSMVRYAGCGAACSTQQSESCTTNVSQMSLYFRVRHVQVSSKNYSSGVELDSLNLVEQYLLVLILSAIIKKGIQRTQYIFYQTIVLAMDYAVDVQFFIRSSDILVCQEFAIVRLLVKDVSPTVYLFEPSGSI